MEQKAPAEQPGFYIKNLYFRAAFMRLTHSRRNGMEVGAIPMSEMVSYFSLFPPPGYYTLADTVDIIISADMHFLHLVKEARKAHEARQSSANPASKIILPTRHSNKRGRR